METRCITRGYDCQECTDECDFYDLVRQVEIIYQKKFPDYYFGEDTFFNTFYLFMERGLHGEDLKEAMEIACNKDLDPANTFRYFCGICWNHIKHNKAFKDPVKQGKQIRR
jgi:hypothetical protein